MGLVFITAIAAAGCRRETPASTSVPLLVPRPAGPSSPEPRIVRDPSRLPGTYALVEQRPRQDAGPD
ncbi:MAG: hypothetical protein JNK05_29890 [Myxococcales bacterium]|nr:hypothetical protein [Myxococcales bacterium]